MITIDLGAIVKEDRERKKLSQEKYADRVGVSGSLIKELEKGNHTNVTLTTLRLFAKEWGLPNINLHFFDPSSEKEAAKHRDILTITSRLYHEDPLTITLLKETYEDDMTKIKKIVQHLKTKDNPT